MKIYMATWLTDRTLGRSLTKKKANTRLISFHFLREQGISPDQLRTYINTGRVDPRKNKDK